MRAPPTTTMDASHSCSSTARGTPSHGAGISTTSVEREVASRMRSNSIVPVYLHKPRKRSIRAKKASRSTMTAARMIVEPATSWGVSASKRRLRARANAAVQRSA